MRCQFCHNTVPSKGYCCDRQELETLRSVADEVVQHLNSEVVETASIGSLEALEPVAHAVKRLERARGRTAA
jgi:hypothetical protein